MDLVDRVARKIRKTMLMTNPSARRHALVGNPSLWKMKRAFQFDFLVEQGLSPDDCLLDIGCGTLRGGAPLIRYLDPGNYIGIDVREDVIAEAHREAKTEGVTDRQPELIVSDFGDGLQLGREVDVAFAFSVLFHMDDGALDNCFKFVAAHLARDGRFFANVNIGDTAQHGQWREFPLWFRSFDDLREHAAAAGLRFHDIGDLHGLGHNSGIPDQDAQRMLQFVLSE